MVEQNKKIIFSKLFLLLATTGMLYYGFSYAIMPNISRYFWIVPAFLFIGLIAYLPWKSISEKLGKISEKLKQISFGWYLLLTASISSFVIGRRVQAGPAPLSYWPLFIIWIASLLWVGIWAVSSYLPTKEWKWKKLKIRLWPYRWEIAAVAVLTLLAFIIRFVNVATLPYPFEHDEAIMAGWTQIIGSGEERNIFSKGFFVAHPLPLYFVRSWLNHIFHIYFAMRIPSVILGTLTIPVFYLLLRQMWDKQVAFIGATYLMAYHYHHHYSRIGLENIADPFFVCLALYFSWRAINYGKRSDFVLLGLSAGLPAYFYIGGRFLVPFVSFLFITIEILKRPKLLKKNATNLVLLILALSVVVFPLGKSWHGHMMERFSNIEMEGGVKQLPTVEFDLIKRKITTAFEMFVSKPERATAHYTPPIPLIEGPSVIFFFIGVIFSLLYFWKPQNYTLLIVFSMAVIAGGILTEGPVSWRLISTIPPIAAWVATGIVKVGNANFRSNKALFAYFIISTALLVGYNLWFYFGIYLPNDYYGDPPTRSAQRLGEHILTLPNNTTVFLYGAPPLFGDHQALTVLTRRRAYDVLQNGTINPLPNLQASPRIFVFLEHRKYELPAIQNACPGGVLRTMNNSRGKFMFYSYELLDNSTCLPTK